MLYKIEKYGDRFRLVLYRTAPAGGKPLDVEKFLSDGGDSEKSDSKLSNNLARTKGRVLELALCNPWEYFVTLTLNADKQDRHALGDFVKSLGVWIGNYNRKFGCQLKYLIVPEQHKDGAWHMHGFFHGVAVESLVKNQYGYLDMPYYQNRFGYISLDPIKNKNKCSTYISKYILKQYENTALSGVEIGKHMFYASQKLDKKEVVEIGEIGCSALGEVWYNDYVGISWYTGYTDVQNFVASHSDIGFHSAEEW